MSKGSWWESPSDDLKFKPGLQHWAIWSQNIKAALEDQAVLFTIDDLNQRPDWKPPPEGADHHPGYDSEDASNDAR